MKKKLLIVVDYQNDFVSGSLGCPQAVAIEDTLAEKIAAYRALGEEGQIIFTMDTHEKNYLETQEGQNLPIAHCIRNTDGWPLYGKIRALKQEEDLVSPSRLSARWNWRIISETAAANMKAWSSQGLSPTSA